MAEPSQTSVTFERTEAMAQPLGAPALAENWSLVSGTQIRWLPITCSLVLLASERPTDMWQACTHIDTHTFFKCLLLFLSILTGQGQKHASILLPSRQPLVQTEASPECVLVLCSYIKCALFSISLLAVLRTCLRTLCMLGKGSATAISATLLTCPFKPRRKATGVLCETV